MDRLPRVTDVQYLCGRTLRLVFSDGLVREFDFEGALAGILATVDSDPIFPQAMIDKTPGTLCWPNGIDLDPDVLHGDHDSAFLLQPVVLREYRLEQAS
jgi:Protein of unknown function (DUF2442)